MEEQRIAELLAGASRDRDVRLLAKNWDRVQGMDDAKRELLRQAAAVTKELGPTGVNGVVLPNALRVGSWIEHHNTDWFGKICYVRKSGASIVSGVAWFGNPAKASQKGRFSMSADQTNDVLKTHTPLLGKPAVLTDVE